MTIAEVAEQLGTSRQRVMQLLAQGRITGTKTGTLRTSAWEIDPASLSSVRVRKVGRPFGIRTQWARKSEGAK